MKAGGIQLLAEFLNCPVEFLKNEESLQRLVQQAAKASGLTVKQWASVSFQPGVTLFAILSQSHIALHTYPEAQHLSLDVYTCTPNDKAAKHFLQFMKQKIRADDVRAISVQRGRLLRLSTGGAIPNAAARGYTIDYHIKRRLISKHTSFQKLELIQNELFGRMLFLDGDLQVAESDHHLYDAALVEPLFAKPRRLEHIVILGGGDGCVAAALCQRNVQRITVVDIDPQVVAVARTHLQDLNNNSFDDPRVTVVHADVAHFLRQQPARFDAAIYDLTMHPERWTDQLRDVYLQHLFKLIGRCLRPQGRVTFQCCSSYDGLTRTLVSRLLKKNFRSFKMWEVNIPSFCEPWVFASATK